MARFAHRMQQAVQKVVLDPFVLGTTEPKLGDYSVGVRANISLTPHNGNFLFTSNNQVVRNLDISGYVHFQGYTGCLMENCIIRGGPAPGYPDNHTLVRFYDAGGRVANNNTLRFCAITPSNSSVDVYGIGGWGWTVERCSITGVVDGTNMHQSTTSGATVKGGKLRGCYIETVWYVSDPRQTDGSHNDGVQIFAGSQNEIIGNSFRHPDRRGNVIVFTPQSDGNLQNTKVNYNWFRGGYTQLSVWANGGFVDVPGVQAIGNRFGLGAHGSTGDHQWDILITQANYDLRDTISGNTVNPGGAAAHININN